jgi:hypothetical protein
MKKDQTTNMLKLTRYLFFLNAAVWLAFGIASLLLRALDGGSLVRWVITVMMVANAAVMFWFGVKIITGQNRVFFLAILYMALNVALSLADQFGWIDALILFLNLCLLGLLFLTRHRMNQNDRVSSREL